MPQFPVSPTSTMGHRTRSKNSLKRETNYGSSQSHRPIGTWKQHMSSISCSCSPSGGQPARKSAGTNKKKTSTNSFYRRTRRADSPDPIDCKLRSWSAWTPCDTCTEKTLRFQYVEKHSQFGGIKCVHSQWDEKQCPLEGECDLQDDCGGDMYTCPETGRCIGMQLRCNGEWDCGFGSDEDDCEEIESRETKCVGMLPIPGAQKATQGFNALSDIFVNPVLDPKYFGGICEYIYNGEWRKLTYDVFCENLYYNDIEKYYRKPHNFLSYRLMAHSVTEGSSEYYTDAVSFLEARRTESSSNFGVTVGIQKVEVGVSGSSSYMFLRNISQYDSKDVGFVRLVSKVETAQFKMRSRDLMLHEDMLQSLLELPEHYNFGSYARFLNEYGTHYITDGTMGGLLEYIVLVNKEAMKRSEMEGTLVSQCLGASLGLSKPVFSGATAQLGIQHKTCSSVRLGNRERESHSGLIHDVITYVKGGTIGATAAKLMIHDANSYRKWGESLKYNPAVIEYEAMPIYELVRFSTAAEQAKTRLPLLKQAWEEYTQQFNPCRCSPCKNNGIAVLSGTACSCLCREGYSGLACEKTTRKGPTHGAWSCWGGWTPCISETKTRHRECNNPQPTDNGFPCQGSSEQRRGC
ncbi:complement component C8 alpha chain [Brachyhypopomus gauderio]|uniref:complement component C8 alpha chain n=1 Tax=Brachyhypopomus gauderio TaxID=698409 RepID=UPI004043582D